MRTSRPILMLAIIISLLHSVSAESYGYANGELVAKLEDGELSYYHLDQLGSVRAITNEQAEVIWRADYKPFGRILDGGNSNPYKFTGKELDSDSGLHYSIARYYDSNTGRFVSVDQARDGANWYAYANNNPLAYIDEDGKGIIKLNIDYSIDLQLFTFQPAVADELKTIIKGKVLQLSGAYPDIYKSLDRLKRRFEIRHMKNYDPENPEFYAVVDSLIEAGKKRASIALEDYLFLSTTEKDSLVREVNRNALRNDHDWSDYLHSNLRGIQKTKPSLIDSVEFRVHKFMMHTPPGCVSWNYYFTAARTPDGKWHIIEPHGWEGYLSPFGYEGEKSNIEGYVGVEDDDAPFQFGMGYEVSKLKKE